MRRTEFETRRMWRKRWDFVKEAGIITGSILAFPFLTLILACWTLLLP